MQRHILPVSLLACCCAGPADSSSGDDSASAADTAAPEPRLDPQFVMDDIELLDFGQGVDLTGDGNPDNALAELFTDPVIGNALGGSPNGWIGQSVESGDLLVMLDFQFLGDFADDRHTEIDMLLGSPSTGDDADPFSGQTPLSVRCGSLAEDGAAASRFDAAALSGGALSGEGGEFLFLMPFARDTVVVLRDAHIEASLAPDGSSLQEGILAGSVRYEDLELVVENDPEIGSGFGELMLAFLDNRLDVDLDGDGDPDAMSAAFAFHAVPALIDRSGACVD